MTATTSEAPSAQDIHAPRRIAVVDSSDLASALADVGALIPSRGLPVPILHGVHLSTTATALTLRRSDYATWTSAEVQRINTDEPADAVVVGARILAAVVRQIGHGVPVTLTVVRGERGTFLRVAGDGVTYQLLTMTAEEYPAPPESEEAHVAFLAAEDVQHLARATAAASRDETLPLLTGVRLSETQGSLVAVATDRFRLIEANSLHPVPAGFTALVPHRVISFVALLAKRDGEVVVNTDQNEHGQGRVVFTVGGRKVWATCIAGEYPKVEALWPIESPTAALFDRDALVKAVRRVAEVAERYAPVQLDFAGDQVVITGGTSYDADATTTVPVVVTAGTQLRVRFNPQYLLDGLATVPGEQIRMTFTQATRPAVITGSDSPHVRYLLMPVRLAD